MRWCLVFLLLNCYFSKCVGEEDLSEFEEVIIPSIANQGGSYNALHKIQFLLDNLFQEKTPNASVEYPGYDGWNNNIGNPELGAIDTPLLRRWPAVYEDGVYQISEKNRPNPLTLSEKLLNGDLGDARSRTGKNVLMVFFGQHIVEEIVDAQRPACPQEYINIKIPEGHRYREKPRYTQMPVLRTRYDQTTGHSPNNPRQQLNEITPFLDGGLIYGTSKTWSDYLRRYTNGTLAPDGLLASSPDRKFPEHNKIRLPMANPPPPSRHAEYIKRHYTEEVDRFFKLGNPRGNENPFLLTFGVIWFRWHNYVAGRLKVLNPHWGGEKIFNEARKWVIATQQSIVYYEWLPQFLGVEPSNYTGYDPAINPQIDQFFQSAAFRFGHTLVPAGVYMRDYGREGCKMRLGGRAIRTCNNYWMSENAIFVNNTKAVKQIDVERLIMGMAVQLAEGEDHKIMDDLRGNLFGPLEFSRRDLMALNIQRARDHGLPDYNTARQAYNLDRVTNVNSFPNVDDKIKAEFLEIYGDSFDNIDIWIGGLFETEDGPGELFRTIIADQFNRIRHGDRFWFENKNNGLFSDNDIDILKSLSFSVIIRLVTDVDEDDLPRNIFKVPVSKFDIAANCTINGVIFEGNCQSMDGTKIDCYHMRIVRDKYTENCTDPGTYDYFENSELSFCLTFFGLFITFLCFSAFVYCQLVLSNRRYTISHSKIQKTISDASDKSNFYVANEWVGYSSPSRPVLIKFHIPTKQIRVENQLGILTRALDLHGSEKIMLFAGHNCHYLLIRVKHNYDLILKFASQYLRQYFMAKLEEFLNKINVGREIVARITTTAVLRQAITMQHRRKKIEQFFRVVFAQAFNIAHSEDELLRIDSEVAKGVVYTELTLLEFAEALSMKPDAEFVKKIFNLVDQDKNGFISFREFIDMLVLFLNGTADDKVQLMFNMYDINGTGELKREEFSQMLKSFMEIGDTHVSDEELNSVINSMMIQAQISKDAIDFNDFKKILGEFSDKLKYVELEFNVNTTGAKRRLHAGRKTIRSSFVGEVKKTVENMYADPQDKKCRVEGIIDNNEMIVEHKSMEMHWNPILKYIANKQLQIFWFALYTIVMFGVFGERIWYYTVMTEHKGLRKIMGYGVALSRGSASAMMFCYANMLLLLCQNIITILRDTVLQFYFPFDHAIEFHKYIACWALVFTIIHVIAHGFNFYHISIQPADDLTCLFRNYFHATHELPKFSYWMWSTITGITGILLTLMTGMIYICSLPVVRRKLYRWFSLGHTLYPIFFILLFLHGSGRLVQEPLFPHYFIIPGTLFTSDKILSATRKTVLIPLVKAELLPSGVTNLIFPKPLNFKYKAGQWIRISCPDLGCSEFHPFTLSSAPHEPTLSVHIRAVGPWTLNIRNKLDPSCSEFESLPSIHIDGPYGESHQHWDKHDISIMVAGGIGVTPFASILKDIVFKSNEKVSIGCKKIYFIWVTRSQKQFEWMVDILRGIEESDINEVMSVHLFITQFYQKFDLRTILLYICERHFQKVSHKSLFTGLRAVTHFGRPNFTQFFSAIQQIHDDINKIGVFSCGSPTLVRSIDNACQNLNSRQDTATLFQHYYKTY